MFGCCKLAAVEASMRKRWMNSSLAYSPSNNSFTATMRLSPTCRALETMPSHRARSPPGVHNRRRFFPHPQPLSHSMGRGGRRPGGRRRPRCPPYFSRPYRPRHRESARTLHQPLLAPRSADARPSPRRRPDRGTQPSLSAQTVRAPVQKLPIPEWVGR